MHFDRELVRAQKREALTEYFNRKQKGAFGNVLAKACQMS